MSNQSEVQATLRSATGSALDYNGDWHALWDSAGIPAGPFNSRMHQWIGVGMAPDCAGAQQAFAEAQGFDNWSGMNQFVVGSAGSDLLLESGACLLLEDGGYILLES